MSVRTEHARLQYGLLIPISYQNAAKLLLFFSLHSIPVISCALSGLDGFNTESKLRKTTVIFLLTQSSSMRVDSHA